MASAWVSPVRGTGKAGPSFSAPGSSHLHPIPVAGEARKQSRENKWKTRPSSLEVDTDMAVRCAQVSVQTGDADDTQDDPSMAPAVVTGKPPEPQAPFMRTSKTGAGSVTETDDTGMPTGSRPAT